MNTLRKSINKKTRFEVFKRDGFKCQYCGSAAPEAILEIDHINPVSKGGDNDLMNLITSCKPCNLGKSDRELSDDSSIQKQRAMLDELNERREQLEMMLQWRDGLKDISEQSLHAFIDEWKELVPGYSLNETGLQQAKKLLRQFPLQTLLDAIHISSENYLSRDSDGNLLPESVNESWRKIGGIANNILNGDSDKELYYIRGICRKRFNYCHEGRCIAMLRGASSLGADTECLKAMARAATSWSDWTADMYQLLDQLGR